MRVCGGPRRNATDVLSVTGDPGGKTGGSVGETLRSMRGGCQTSKIGKKRGEGLVPPQVVESGTARGRRRGVHGIPAGRNAGWREANR